MITLEEAHEWFSYDPETGIVRWRKSKTYHNKAGDEVGKKPNAHGYKVVNVFGKVYRLHRLIWFMCNGVWPDTIDHINRVRTDNRISNMRDITNAQNIQNQLRKNNKYLPGVTKLHNKFVAQISVNGKNKVVGRFMQEMEAHLAYMEAKANYHKFFNKD